MREIFPVGEKLQKFKILAESQGKSGNFDWVREKVDESLIRKFSNLSGTVSTKTEINGCVFEVFEKWQKHWKSQWISSEEISGNADNRYH